MIEHRSIDVGDELALHIELRGEGLPVVLLHGFTGSTATWRPLAERLGTRFRTAAVDLPGHGQSSAPLDPARYGFRRFADDLARVLDSLGLDRTALLGYSLGGRAALRFARQHPSRVSALVLESTSSGMADAAGRSARAATDAELARFIESEGIEAFTDRWERLPLWASQAALPPEVRAALRAQRMGNVALGLANSLRGAGAGSTDPVTGELTRIDVPALLVAGALDDKYSAAARLMAAAMPRAQLALVERAGHTVHLEQPAKFAEIVEAFLRDALQSPARPAGR